MNRPWAISLDEKDADAVASLRLVPGIEVATAEGLVWLRSQTLAEPVAPKLAALPARARYEWMPPDRLRPQDCRIPSGQLPGAVWKPLREWLHGELPVAALPAALPDAVPLRLIRSTTEQEAELLLTTFEAFRQFATEAAQIRLERLHFAASEDAQVLVRGRPLPSLPGRRFVLHQGVAVPAGFAWQPAVSAEVMNCRFEISANVLVVWHEDNTVTRLHAEQWIPATRSAVRATADYLARLP